MDGSEKIKNVAIGSLIGVFISTVLEEAGVEEAIEDGVSKLMGSEDDRQRADMA